MTRYPDLAIILLLVIVIETTLLLFGVHLGHS